MPAISQKASLCIALCMSIGPERASHVLNHRNIIYENKVNLGEGDVVNTTGPKTCMLKKHSASSTLHNLLILIIIVLIYVTRSSSATAEIARVGSSSNNTSYRG